MKAIMLATQKGGVGKTTATIELSNIFAKNNKVLMIDLDSQRNLSMYSDADVSPEKKTIIDVLEVKCSIYDAIQNLKTTKNGKLDIVIASKKLADANKIFTDPDDIFLLKDVLEILKNNNDYDYVFIDNGPARGPALFMSYLASDYIISPAGPCEGSMTGLMEVGIDVSKFKKRYGHAKLLGYFMYAYEKTTAHNVALDTFEAMSEQLGCQPFKTIIPKSVIATECKSLKMSIYDYANDFHIKNKISKAYISLADEIEERIKEDETNG